LFTSVSVLFDDDGPHIDPLERESSSHISYELKRAGIDRPRQDSADIGIVLVKLPSEFDSRRKITRCTRMWEPSMGTEIDPRGDEQPELWDGEISGSRWKRETDAVVTRGTSDGGLF
jgi:hypothetical protein